MTNREYVDLIYDSVKQINSVYEKWSLKHGLTLYEMQVYYVLLQKKEERITQKELCEILDAPKTSVNSMIKKQIQRGYVELCVNEKNKREKIVKLTQDGMVFAKQLILPLFKMEEEAISMLDTKKIQQAIHIQLRFANALREKMEDEDE